MDGQLASYIIHIKIAMNITRRIEAASRAQRLESLTHFLPEGIQIEDLTPGLLPCLVSQLAPLVELIRGFGLVRFQIKGIQISEGPLYYVPGTLLPCHCY